MGRPFCVCAKEAASVAIVAVAMVFAIFVAQMLAPLVGFVPFMLPMTGVAAVRTEALDGLPITQVGVGDAPIAVVPIVGLCGGAPAAKKKPRAAVARAVLPSNELSLNE